MPFTPYNSGQPSTATVGAKPTPGFTPFNTVAPTVSKLPIGVDVTNSGQSPFGGARSPSADISDSFKSGIGQIEKGGQEIAQGGIGNISKGVISGAAGALNAATSPITGVLKSASKLPGVSQALGAVKNYVVDPLANAISDSPALQKFMTSHPDADEVAQNLITIGATFAGGKSAPEVPAAVKGAATEASNIASDVTTLTKNVLPEAKPPVLNEAAVAQKYNKAIKPSVAGKNTQTQIQQANSKAVSGVKTIADNKANLSFTDEAGNTITGQTPKSVDQLSQAIEQTKKSVFSQYNALAKQAGEQGINVDTKAIAQELQPIIESKSLAIANPRAIQYAKDVQKRLNSVGAIDAETAQDVIKHYNDSLKAFYRNPNYDTASQAGIDSMIANQFRTKLDEGISGATGAQYQSLKNQYGALASIEKDVAKRAQTLAKSSPSGFINTISNMASGAELVKGLVTLSPSSIAKAGAIKGIEAYMKYLNNPDVGVSKMFSQIEKSNSSPKVSQAATPFQPKSNTVKGIMSAAEKYKSIPNKDGGFVKIGSQTFKEIPEATKKEMIQSIDYLRLSKELDSAAEKQVDRLAQKYNISQDLSSIEISNKLEQLIENTKTK